MFIHSVWVQLIQSPAMASLGLVLLKTTSEELACPREDLSVARKDELRKLLLEQVPTVLRLLTGERPYHKYHSLLNHRNIMWYDKFTTSLCLVFLLCFCPADILETIWDKHSVTAATPPPSPTSGESGEKVGLESYFILKRSVLPAVLVHYLLVDLIGLKVKLLNTPAQSSQICKDEWTRAEGKRCLDEMMYCHVCVFSFIVCLWEIFGNVVSIQIKHVAGQDQL